MKMINKVFSFLKKKKSPVSVPIREPLLKKVVSTTDLEVLHLPMAVSITYLKRGFQNEG